MASVGTAPFRVGGKELFLPKFRIALLRTPRLPPTLAKFQVPLWFSKLDLRDYLFHAYGVETVGVRSYVQQSRVQSGRTEDIKPAIRRWHRPQARKYMTVELAQPFRWPPEPVNEAGVEYAEWNKTEVGMSDKQQEQLREGRSPRSDTMVNEERRKRMREQALALLKGEKKWEGSKWKFVRGSQFSGY